jgi:hypothetical protein
MPRRPEHAPGEAAPATGTYEQLNIFGGPTGIRVTLTHNHPFAEAPIGHSWTLIERMRLIETVRERPITPDRNHNVQEAIVAKTPSFTTNAKRT